MKILVTGASGFFGPRLVSELLEKGDVPLIFDKGPREMYPYSIVRGAVRDLNALTDAVRRFLTGVNYEDISNR